MLKNTIIVRHNQEVDENNKYKGLAITTSGNYFYSLLAKGELKSLAGVPLLGDTKFYGLLLAGPLSEDITELEYEVITPRSGTDKEEIAISFPEGKLAFVVDEQTEPAVNGIGTKTFYHLSNARLID